MKTNASINDPKILIQLAKEGNKEAFGRLYELYFVPIFRYIYFRVMQKSEAEDLTQEVFLKAYEVIENFKDQKKSPLNYFFTLARNKIIDYCRKKKEVSTGEILNNLPSRNDDPLEIIEKKEIDDILKEAIQDLTEEQREVILLKFINDLSTREIASLLQKSQEAVRQLQCRAIKILRHKFKDLKIL